MNRSILNNGINKLHRIDFIAELFLNFTSSIGTTYEQQDLGLG